MRIFGSEQIRTFNEHGDQVSEIRLEARPNPSGRGGQSAAPNRTETSIDYRYDSQGNWIEKTTTWIAADGVGKPGDTTRRTITYYSQ